jgi:hypothetical protein
MMIMMMVRIYWLINEFKFNWNLYFAFILDNEFEYKSDKTSKDDIEGKYYLVFRLEFYFIIIFRCWWS